MIHYITSRTVKEAQKTFTSGVTAAQLERSSNSRAAQTILNRKTLYHPLRYTRYAMMLVNPTTGL